MSAQLWVDPAHLRSVAPRFDALSQRMAEVAATLHSTLEAEGECWGGDQTGTTFANGYLPSAEVAEHSLGFAVGALAALATELRSTADSFDDTDRGTASSLAGLF
ncbi:WXG100 family type VII secretion target [Rhodococcus wratislaviensis]|uniref:WXG100 family type VII secretion target n=1 Tax=Rhodococcus wratislaviensis TaxID=44752 RepID=UPI00364DF995